MNNRAPRSFRLLFLPLIALVCSNWLLCQANPSWAVRPSYETSQLLSTALIIKDTDGVSHTLYEESHAVLIIEGNYRENGWANVADPGAKNADLLVKRLEARGFHVVVWKDLTGSQLLSIISEINPNLGRVRNSRLFLYFYGHGYRLNLSADSDVTRTYLVPVDAPNPVTNEKKFLQVALPITQLLELSKQVFAKHTFFALEACKSGAIAATLDSDFLFPKPLGYVLSPEILGEDHKILTAASQDQTILANSPFTPLLAAALEHGDLNHDGYVTGSEVVSFVKENLPRAVPGQTPQFMWFPLNDNGDFIFGPAQADSGPAITRPKVPAVISPAVTTSTTPATVPVVSAKPGVASSHDSTRGDAKHGNSERAGTVSATEEESDRTSARSATVSPPTPIAVSPGKTLIWNNGKFRLPSVQGFGPIPIKMEGTLRRYAVLPVGQFVEVGVEHGEISFSDPELKSISCRGLSVSSSTARALDPSGAIIVNVAKVTIQSSSGSVEFYSKKMDDAERLDFKNALEYLCAFGN